MPSHDKDLSQLTDAELVVIAQDDLRAFDVLYRRYGGLVSGYAHARLQSRVEAEDVLSATFQRAMMGIHTLRDPEKFRPWLFRIAYTQIVEQQRYRAAHPAGDRIVLEEVPGRQDVEGQVVAADERRRVADCIQRLSSDQREVMHLHLADRRGPEIAGLLNLSQAAVRMRLSRGIRSLRACVGGEPA